MADPDSLVVMTSCGAVRGTERDGVAVWRGIPYAEPPVGALRWLPPRPPRAWEGERDATRFGPVAVQPRDPRTALLSGVGDKVPMSEDCLVLNVFAPAVRAPGSRRPVMVWIHGGAFVMGSGSTPLYHGNSFVADDIVVVTLNYRLGVLGFLYLGHRSDAHRAGNVALLDQIAALAWVRDNIAAFGGDPDNVTVMGESAGAVSIATLLAIPAARGLFHAAILESGASQLVVPTRTDAIEIADAILAELGIGTGSDLAALAELGVDRLVGAQLRMSAARGLSAFAPFVDEVTVPRPPIEAVRDGSGITVPLLIGWNRDEWALFAVFMGDAAVEPVKPALRARFGGGIDQLLAAYEHAGERSPWVALIGDGVFRIPSVRLADAMSTRAPVFVYRFDWASPTADGRLGAAHALELPFVWNRLDLPASQFLLGGEVERARPLAAQIHATWAAFIHTHAPGGQLAVWPAYDTTRRAIMLIDDASHVVDDPAGEIRRLWAEVAGA